jgi:hypothetical protein
MAVVGGAFGLIALLSWRNSVALFESFPSEEECGAEG